MCQVAVFGWGSCSKAWLEGARKRACRAAETAAAAAQGAAEAAAHGDDDDGVEGDAARAAWGQEHQEQGFFRHEIQKKKTFVSLLKRILIILRDECFTETLVHRGPLITPRAQMKFLY